MKFNVRRSTGPASPDVVELSSLEWFLLWVYAQDHSVIVHQPGSAENLSPDPDTWELEIYNCNRE